MSRGFNLVNNLPPHIQKALMELDLSIPEGGTYHEIISLLNQTVLLGGKRFRPMLLFLIGDLFAIPMGRLAPFARAIEYVHVASLCHDDVIDSASMRRGLPSINVVASNKMAILSGDYLLAKVIQDLCMNGHLPSLQALSTVIMDLSLGEWMQSQTNGKFQEPPDKEWIDTIIKKKTASLIAWSCLVPALLSNAPSSMMNDLKQLGLLLGEIFQLTDDILDFTTPENTPPEEILSDLQSGTVNSVLSEYFHENPTQWSNWREGKFNLDSADFTNAMLIVEKKCEIVGDQALKTFQALIQNISHFTTKNLLDSPASLALELLIRYLPNRKK
ncbi:MAG: polyprenyl synthetase family protein [Oligoflexia bacterium]|nr:polyprenyl synthetase family protein [Oligoflexia bacterium]MBF0366550.1 polyprenyl synthetase family protein [Oligoflexia bacterium]